jgi:hypothetical protein
MQLNERWETQRGHLTLLWRPLGRMQVYGARRTVFVRKTRNTAVTFDPGPFHQEDTESAAATYTLPGYHLPSPGLLVGGRSTSIGTPCCQLTWGGRLD